MFELASVPGRPESRHPPRGRRRDDGPRELAALTLARYLAGGPDLADVTRFLVALCWPINAEGAVIVSRTRHDHFEVLAQYVDQVADWDCAEGSQALRSVISDISAAAIGNHEVLWTDEESPAGRPMAAWPLGVPADPVGVLVVFLARRAEPALVGRWMDGAADVLAVYLAGARSRPALDPDPHPAGRPPIPDSVHLTARQVAILRLMARNLTNRQIAARIRFSDSTVRAESLAIYRALDVRDRQQAVVVGEALGLLRSRPSAPTKVETAGRASGLRRP